MTPFRSIEQDLGLGFDLGALVEWTLVDPFVQRLANASCNHFFEPDSRRGIRVRQDGDLTCWGILPAEWRSHFERITDPAERDRVLVELSSSPSSSPSTLPKSLESFLDTCQSLSLDRTCSLDDPVLSYPPDAPRRRCRPDPVPVPPFAPTPTPSHLKGKAKAHHTNALKAGQSPKKQHEVAQFCALVQSILDDEPCSYCIDVGSGRAHLSRALATRPLDLHVLALDWSSSQKSGAEKIDEIRTRAELHPTVGSLTHRVSSLDERGVKHVLHEWPPAPPPRPDGADHHDEGEGQVPRREPSLLVALHACGDLTPDAIKAFTDFSVSAASTLTSAPRAVFVGCCYNLQTPSRFPLSRSMAACVRSTVPRKKKEGQEDEDDDDAITLAHLRLTPQSPATWHTTRHASAAFRSATSKLGYRARLEAELDANGFGTGVGARKVGRIPDCATWDEYRTKAVARIAGPAWDGCRVDDWDAALFQLRVWWTIRSWLGPPLESLVVLDRYLLLVEGLYPAGGATGGGGGPSRRVEMVNIFDQATGSLRNIALVVR
ncbi:hypothetical protein JCM11491_002993 [Sporobolomyces phaffii]